MSFLPNTGVNNLEKMNRRNENVGPKRPISATLKNRPISASRSIKPASNVYGSKLPYDTDVEDYMQSKRKTR